ncbi:hypothetical protein GCM10011380_04450 [Sphingomonas metalli]|uniref:C-type lysozyme inhibitor domain-containing protein n=1 Tax=Sphingomonas metalli TaxID=1779358 RepID=A0A916SXB7_9SPHN|nr:MliC family protein [Sphingomonas metalli]GGB18012.1 hypothetical protein GCM10011380_04450 [Sphingomonas metalli]
MTGRACGVVLAMALALPGCSSPPERAAASNAAPVVSASPSTAGGRPSEAKAVVRPATAAPDPGDPAAVAAAFLRGAIAKDQRAAAAQWDGTPADRQQALAVLAGLSGTVTIGAPVDGDAGMGQRYVTVPFAIGDRHGSALLHRIADGFDSDDPRAHDWRVRTVTFDEEVPVASAGAPETANARYACTDGSVVPARFDNRDGTVALTVGGASVTLRQQPVASGIHYAGAGFELRGKGRRVVLTLPDGATKDCEDHL